MMFHAFTDYFEKFFLPQQLLYSSTSPGYNQIANQITQAADDHKEFIKEFIFESLFEVAKQ